MNGKPNTDIFDKILAHLIGDEKLSDNIFGPHVERQAVDDGLEVTFLQGSLKIMLVPGWLPRTTDPYEMEIPIRISFLNKGIEMFYWRATLKVGDSATIEPIKFGTVLRIDK